MKNDKFICIFSVTVIILAAAIIIMPWIIHAVSGDSTSSDENALVEKRDLTEFPNDYSNDWFSRLESYFSDHSPIRNRLIGLESQISGKYNLFYRNKIDPVLTKMIVHDYDTGETEITPEEGATPTAAPTVDLGILIGGTATPAATTPEATNGGTIAPTAETTDAQTTPPETDEPATPPPTDEPAASLTAEPTDILTTPPSGTEVPASTAQPTAILTPTPPPTLEPTPVPTEHVHKFDGGIVEVAANCQHEGRKVYTCTVCGEMKTEAIPMTSHEMRTVMSSTADLDNYGYTLKRCDVCGYYSLEDIVYKQVNNTFLAPSYSGAAIFGRRDWLFYSGNNSEGYYRGTNILSDAEMDSWRQTFERLDAVCKEKGIDLVILVAPNKEQMYPEYMPTYQVETERKRQDVMLEYMTQNSSVKYLYPKSELSVTKIFYDVFYKQDTHWNLLGGFTGTMAVYRALGLATTNVFELDVKETTRTGGDLSNFSGYSTTYREWSVSYKNDLTTTRQNYENHVTSSSTELSQFFTPGAIYADKKLVVMGDSFRHAMSTFMTKDFGKSTFAHRDELVYETPVVVDALRELGEGDVLVLMCVERLDGNLCDSAIRLTDILGR